MNTNAATRTYQSKQAQRLTAVLCFSQFGGALSIHLALTRLQRLPLDPRTAVARWVWIGLALTVLVGLCWVSRVSERQRLLRLQATARFLIVLDAVLLVLVIRVAGGFLRSPFDLLLASVPVVIVILRSLPSKGWIAFAVHLLLTIVGLFYWRISRSVTNATTASRYDVFADPGFLQAFAITAAFVLLLFGLCLTLRKAEMVDMAANAFFADRSRISYAERMSRRD